MKMIKLCGAVIGGVHGDEDDMKEYVPKGPVWVKKRSVLVVYDHMLLLRDRTTVQVMETGEEIIKKLTEGRDSNEDQA